MRKLKIAAFGLASLAAVAVPSLISYDSAYNSLEYTNSAYCSVYNFFSGFDKNDIVDVDVGIYMDAELTGRQRRDAMEAFESARQEYYNEFGINLIPRRKGSINAPKNTDDIKYRIQNTEDFSIFFVEQVKNDIENAQGMAYRQDNIIAVNASTDKGCVENIIAHETGHLFYAEHEDKNKDEVLCVMFHANTCFNMYEWCDAGNVIRKYKHRIW